MSDYKAIKFNLNKFFKEIHLKKQYLKKMQKKAYFLSELKETSYKKVSSQVFYKPVNTVSSIFVMYIIKIYFSKKNTLFHLSDYAGNIKFFYSAGSFQQKGKSKVSRSIVLKKFYKILTSKLKFIKKVPLAVHFKHADSNMFWFVKKLKKKFFITVVKHFNKYPYNGCRKKKIRRKKFKSKSLSI